jgi:hypothetical protein
MIRSLFILALSTLGLISCTDTIKPADSKEDVKMNKSVGARVPFGESGHTIQLLPDYTIEKQSSETFEVYYFKPADSTLSENEAGIYFGPRPDTSAPSVDYTKKQFPGTFMGNTVTWTEYTTDKYTQREVFIDQGPEQKIHCWCYSHDPIMLNKLWEMVKTVQ